MTNEHKVQTIIQSTYHAYGLMDINSTALALKSQNEKEIKINMHITDIVVI